MSNLGLGLGLFTIALACIWTGAPVSADWHRVPGGIRLEGPIRATEHNQFLNVFWQAALEEPKYAPIAIFIASDGGDEGAARELVKVIVLAQSYGVKFVLIREAGFLCSDACNLLGEAVKERYRLVLGEGLEPID